MRAINPTQPYAIVELERIKWFLSHIDLTVDNDTGDAIQEAYDSVSNALRCLAHVPSVKAV